METQSIVRQKIVFWVFRTALYVSKWKIRTKWLSIEPFNFNFFQTLSGKDPAVLWKLNSTRPDEPKKNEVLVRSSFIPNNVFAIWRRYFGFMLYHFSMAGDNAFYAFKERIEKEYFLNIFCFSLVTWLWVKLYRIFGRIFPMGCHWCNLLIQGNMLS